MEGKPAYQREEGKGCWGNFWRWCTFSDTLSSKMLIVTTDVLGCAQDSCVNGVNVLNKRTEETLNKYQIAVIINFLKLQDTASPQSEFGKVKLFNKAQLQKNWSHFSLGDQSLRRKWI